MGGHAGYVILLAGPPAWDTPPSARPVGWSITTIRSPGRWRP